MTGMAMFNALAVKNDFFFVKKVAGIIVEPVREQSAP